MCNVCISPIYHYSRPYQQTFIQLRQFQIHCQSFSPCKAIHFCTSAFPKVTTVTLMCFAYLPLNSNQSVSTQTGFRTLAENTSAPEVNSMRGIPDACCVENKCNSLIISSGSYKQPSISPEQNLSLEPVSGKAKDKEDDTIAPTSSVTFLTMSP